MGIDMGNASVYLHFDYLNGEMVLTKTKPKGKTSSFMCEGYNIEPTARLGFVHIHYAMVDGGTVIQVIPMFLSKDRDENEQMNFIVEQLRKIKIDGLYHHILNIKGETVDGFDWDDIIPPGMSESDNAIYVAGWEIRTLRVID